MTHERCIEREKTVTLGETTANPNGAITLSPFLPENEENNKAEEAGKKANTPILAIPVAKSPTKSMLRHFVVAPDFRGFSQHCAN